jgi:nondiscriminating aspartyl-tRNA synthetase
MIEEAETENIGNWKRSHFSTEIPKKDDTSVTVMGWVRAIRKVGKLTFLQVADREGFVQIIFKGVSDDIQTKLDLLQRESVIAIKGKVKVNKTAPNGLEVIPSEMKILNLSEVPLPLEVVTQKTPADMITRLNSRFMDLRKPEISAIFKIKDMVAKATREYFDKNKFIEIQSPKLMSVPSESGANVFEVNYFKTKAFLAQSPQFYKQIMMAAGFDRVYEIAPIFRAEKHHTYRHVTEFTSMDFEMSFVDFEDVLSEAENLMVHIYKYVQTHCTKELTILDKKITIPSKPFPRVSMSEAFKMINEKDNGEDLSSDQEKVFYEACKKKFDHEFVFLVDFPWSVRPFYHMKKDSKITFSADLLCKGLEIATLAQREHRYEILMKQLKDKKILPKGIEHYLNAFKFGMPPHGGAGLGLDRIVMKMLDLPNIREAVLFPRDPERLTP